MKSVRRCLTQAQRADSASPPACVLSGREPDAPFGAGPDFNERTPAPRRGTSSARPQTSHRFGAGSFSLGTSPRLPPTGGPGSRLSAVVGCARRLRMSDCVTSGAHRCVLASSPAYGADQESIESCRIRAVRRRCPLGIAFAAASEWPRYSVWATHLARGTAGGTGVREIEGLSPLDGDPSDPRSAGEERPGPV
jgi:hypothetical protein